MANSLLIEEDNGLFLEVFQTKSENISISINNVVSFWKSYEVMSQFKSIIDRVLLFLNLNLDSVFKGKTGEILDSLREGSTEKNSLSVLDH